jgi:hypothetical protein
VRPITESQFNTLFRSPLPALHAKMCRELEWYATDDGRLLGSVVLDKIDRDFSWVVLCRDDRGKYRATAYDTSLPSQDAARRALSAAMGEAATRTDIELQGTQDQLPAGITAEQFERLLDVLTLQELALLGRY